MNKNLEITEISIWFYSSQGGVKMEQSVRVPIDRFLISNEIKPQFDDAWDWEVILRRKKPRSLGEIDAALGG